MWGRLKWFQDKKFNLLCQDGVWKTGYEDIGLDVSGVCVPKGMHVYKAYVTMPRSRWGGGGVTPQITLLARCFLGMGRISLQNFKPGPPHPTRMGTHTNY